MQAIKGNWIRIAGLALACCGLPGIAAAATISRTGTFVTDDQIFELTFTLNSTSTVTVESFAYGGGTNGAGTAIAQGGFATDVAVFSAAGSMNLLDEDSVGGSAPGGCGPRHINSSTGYCLDGYVTIPSLAAGTYILSLTEQGNNANGPTLSDGFAQAGNGNFTGGPFLDPVSSTQLNGKWAVDVSAAGLAVSTVPEPGGMLLALLSVPGLAILARRRSRT